MMYRYRANGLNLESAFEIPEMMPGSGEPDVVIRYGDVPERIPDSISMGPCSEATPREYLLKIPDVARFWVREGRLVVISPEPGVGEDDIRVFVLSSIMGSLAHQNGFLPLHASAVEMGGECVLFAGSSGNGKSTLAAALYGRGHRLMADDLCAISVDSRGRPMVHPGYRHLKLWADALDELDPSMGELHRVRSEIDKFSVRLTDRVGSQALPLRKVFALTPRTSATVEFQEMEGREKLNFIRRETFRLKLVRGFGVRETHFALCSALAKNTPMYLVRRPQGFDGLGQLVLHLEERLDTEAPAE